MLDNYYSINIIKRIFMYYNSLSNYTVNDGNNNAKKIFSNIIWIFKYLTRDINSSIKMFD